MEAVLVNEGCELQLTAPGALVPGEVVQIADGRAAVVTSGLNVASGAQVALAVAGIFDVASASGTTFSAGDQVFWDVSANLAITAPGAADDFLLGPAVLDKASGKLVVRVALNVQLRMVGGVVTLDGTNPTPVNTGLATIVTANAQLNQSTAPGDDPNQLSVTFTGGVLSIYAWKNTSGTDPTMVASTNSSAVIAWQAWGYA